MENGWEERARESVPSQEHRIGIGRDSGEAGASHTTALIGVSLGARNVPRMLAFHTSESGGTRDPVERQKEAEAEGRRGNGRRAGGREGAARGGPHKSVSRAPPGASQ